MHAKYDILRSLPKDFVAYHLELFGSLHNGQKVIPCELTHFTGKTGGTIRKENLRFTIATRVEQELAGPRVAGVVLKADIHLQIAQRHPSRLSAPAGLNQFVLQRQQ